LIHTFQVTRLNTFKQMFTQIQELLLQQEPYEVGEWQSQKIETRMLELRNLSFSMPLPWTASELAQAVGAHLPWAEDHFLERVGGHPLNPSPSEAWWPFARKQNADHKSEGEAFSHTYPERMWPKYANQTEPELGKIIKTFPHQGIRFGYGDLRDIVNQLTNTPHTRQAYLPIWFPEDTGVVHGKRVPCTLGYHFSIRNSTLDITYYMRSTDLLRHFQDDIYLAGRLAQWVATEINKRRHALNVETGLDVLEPIQVGELIFHTANMHIFEPDVAAIDYRKSQGNDAWAVI